MDHSLSNWTGIKVCLSLLCCTKTIAIPKVRPTESNSPQQ